MELWIAYVKGSDIHEIQKEEVMAITYTPAKKEQSPPDFGTKRETMKWSVVDEEKK